MATVVCLVMVETNCLVVVWIWLRSVRKDKHFGKTSLVHFHKMARVSKAERLWHAKNWLRRGLVNYDEQRCQQFLEPRIEAMRVEQYFRISLDDEAVLYLHGAFLDHPVKFQMFLFMFWAHYWDGASGYWN